MSTMVQAGWPWCVVLQQPQVDVIQRKGSGMRSQCMPGATSRVSPEARGAEREIEQHTVGY